MAQKKVQFNKIVKQQLPSYVQSEFPLVGEFLSAYYKGQEYQGGPIDLISNIDKYIKLSECGNITKETTLTTRAEDYDTTLNVPATFGFPDNNGLLKINNEIISYGSKTDISFVDCVRGFSGITSYTNPENPEDLIFSTSEAEAHEEDTIVENLSALFLEEFLRKIKNQLLYGIQKDLHDDLDKGTFITRSKDFYSSRGTDESFKILFKALFNENADLHRPMDHVISPSNAGFRKTWDIIVESIMGNPLELVNKTLFQDHFENIDPASAPVAHVESINIGLSTNIFWKVSLDSSWNLGDGSMELMNGNFASHAKSLVIGDVGVAQTYIDVDSTLGFPNSGTLALNYGNGSSGIATYSHKTLNQFLGINTTSVGATIKDQAVIDQNTYAYSSDTGAGTTDGIRVKIRSVLNNLTVPPNTRYYTKGAKIKTKSLGLIGTSFAENNWLFNTIQNYDIKFLFLIDEVNSTYRLITKDPNILRIGDNVRMYDKNNVLLDNKFEVRDVYDEYNCIIRGEGLPAPSETGESIHETIVNVRREFSRVDSDIHINLNNLIANIQNIYVGSDSVLVASNSLPATGRLKLNTKDSKVVISGTYIEGETEIVLTTGVDHNFYTGDAVYYTPDKDGVDTIDSEGNVIRQEWVKSQLFSEGLYFVYRIDDNKVKFAKSRSNISAGIFAEVETSIDYVTIENNTVEKYYFKDRKIQPQKLLRKIGKPVYDGKVHETPIGNTGILINGVEILNYKSRDAVYAGQLDSVEVTKGGENYDVINPPVLSIIDAVGTGATGVVAVEGNFKEIKVLNPGYDYIETPIVNISGGGGEGATAIAKLVTKEHIVTFDATGLDAAIRVGLDTSIIGFSTYHKFRAGERVRYETHGKKSLTGLSTGAVYYVGPVDDKNIKLYTTLPDAIAGVGTTGFTDFGEGNHDLQSLNGKAVVGSITLTNPGSGYKNKKRTFQPVGVNTASDIITIQDHQFKDLEVVRYSLDIGDGQNTIISGLSTTLDYYIKVLDENSFKLANVGVGTTVKDFYYNTNQFAEFRSTGLGTHSFNYPPITVDVVGSVGISSIAGDTFECIAQPIVRGEITSIHLIEKGVGYGSSEILNFERDPDVKLWSGNDAFITPVINSAGNIVDVSVNFGGTDYNSPPSLAISGFGTGADLVPELDPNTGKVLSVKVNKGGIGYGSSTTIIKVVASGKGAYFKPRVQKWRVNEFRRNFRSILNDDAFISVPTNKDYELQCSYLYAPRSLRKILYTSGSDGDVLYGKKDLTLANGQESNTDKHSPIIGWSYDGYPIYGPYGYTSRTGGSIIQLKSGYKERSVALVNRPPTTVFPEEFFVEDFEWSYSSDDGILDEKNGRFCVTPEYPNGTYAYFATFESQVEGTGPFVNYKRPAFPYLIGDTYNAKPEPFNFERLSNQEAVDLNETDWSRNTYPYSLDKDHSGYNYVIEPYNYIPTDSVIRFAEKGGVTSVGILTGGTNYKVGDKLVFEKDIPNTFGAAGKVSRVAGSGIGTISITASKMEDVEFYPLEGRPGAFVGFATTSHGFINNTLLSLSGINTTNSKLEGSYNIGISTNVLQLEVGIATEGVTGIVTYLSVKGDLRYPSIKENDVLRLAGILTTGFFGDEYVRVLNIDRYNSRVRVLRDLKAQTGLSHTATTTIKEVPRKFTFVSSANTSYTSRINREYYFNPIESVGLGSAFPVGLAGTLTGAGTTVFFANPGAGATQHFVPSQTIYLRGHELETGDQVTYHTNSLGADAIGIITSANQVATGDKIDLTSYSSLYVTRVSHDLIGISTVRVGLGSTGSYVGTADTTSHQGLAYFSGVGTGFYHSFKTIKYNDIVKGSIEQNLVTVACASSHRLRHKDEVVVSINPRNTGITTIKYDPTNRKMFAGGLYFTASGITTSASITGNPNSISIPNHNLVTGQKIIHKSDTPSGGLIDKREYFVYVIDRDRIKLTADKYETQKGIPTFVGITTANVGTLCLVNPPLTYYDDTTITFDLSDSSLSYRQSSTDYPAFELEFYLDSQYTQRYQTNGVGKEFDIIQTGDIGVSTDAKVTLKINQYTPSLFYYRLNPVDLPENPKINKEIVTDADVASNNEIITKKSAYAGRFNILQQSSNTFIYDIPKYPEVTSYSGSASTVEYDTDSTTAVGRITDVKITSSGNGYLELPGITTVTSDLGTGVILESSSDNIGRVKKTSIENVGFDYPTDKTLRPRAIFPQVLTLEQLTGFNAIGITSVGRGYNTPPSLVVLDGKTKKIVTDIDLEYNAAQKKVNILKNSNSMYNTTPTILPIGNPNGVRFKDISYDSNTQIATATVRTPCSRVEDFWFEVGMNIMVENASVGVASTGNGYNSSQYDYDLFTISGVSTNLGAYPTISWSMADHLIKADNQLPGQFDSVNSSVIITPQRFFPRFAPTLKDNLFNVGETVSDGLASGVISRWDEENSELTVESNREFTLGKILETQETGAKATIIGKLGFEAKYDLDYYAIVDNGWEYTTGFLNDELQRIHDNDYYQNFSYSIKSRVTYEDWKDVVSALNHTAGFRKWSDFQMESSSDDQDALHPIPVGDTTVVVDMLGEESLHCVEIFDLATENYFIADRPFSDEVTIKNRILTDYAESIGNRVLNVDDISQYFDDNARTTRYSDILRQSVKDGRSQKIVALIRDRLYGGERQIMMINALHDIDRGFSMINQYGDVSTVSDLGGFDYTFEGGESVLRFYPTKYEVNNYNVRTFSYNIDRNVLGIETSVPSIGSTTLGISTDFTGSLISIASTNVSIAGGAADEIYRFVGVGTNISGTRSAKILVTAETDTGRVEYDEVSLICDGTEVSWMEYGQLTIHSYQDPYSSTGNIGTFYSYMNGQDIVLKYTPEAGFTTTRINAIAVAFSTEGYKNTSESSYDFTYGTMQTQSTFMEASADPDEVGIGSYSDDYDAAYCIIQATDPATNSHCLSELLIVDDYAADAANQVYLNEYGEVHVGTAFTDLGTLSGRRASEDRTEITYRPASGRDIDVKIFMNVLRVDENTNIPGGREVGGEILKEFNNATIESNGATYEGTENTVRKAFNLSYKTEDIFRRNFDGSSPVTINVADNTIELSNHFFVSGEEVKYSVSSGFTTDAIGIANTTFAGIGATTFTPSSVFVIKKSENKIQLARSAEDALASIPVPLDISSVGIGTSHSLTGVNPNQKVLFAIDNMIQSPIAGTSVTTTLADSAALAQDVIKFTGISSFAGADYIQVGSGNTIECMKILSVGIGSTNQIKVRRGWLGTPEAGFTTGTTVQKIRGHYNVVENNVHFIEPPHGQQPMGSTTNPPDERDWVGITTASSFQGRVFMRGGIPNGTEETYTKNYLYDDISQKFTGYTKEFPLTVDNANVTGIATNNAIIIINGVFQGPGLVNNYTMSEAGSASTITFTGTASSVGFDPNNANIPVGGVIVSVSSTDGFGYQPLVSAGGTVTVSSAGTVSAISIGNTGSGYRVGLQTVNVAIQTSSNLEEQSYLDRSSFIGMGTAQIVDGHITGIAITNSGILYTPRDIVNVGYNSVTGIATITTFKPHEMVVGDEVKISGLAMTCNYAGSMSISTASFHAASGIMTVSVGLNTVGVTTFSYDNAVGVGTVTLASAHNIAHKTGVGRSFTLAGLNVGLARSGTDYGSTTWPNSDTATGDTFTIVSIPSPTAIKFTAGISTLTHTYSSGGHIGYGHKMKVGDTAILTGLGFTGHSGLTTDYYPHGKDQAYDTSVEITSDGTAYTVTNASYNPTTGVLTLTVPAHGFSNGDKIRLVDKSLTFTCAKNDHKTQHEYPRATDPVSGEWLTISNKTTNTFRVNVLTNAPSSNTSTHTFVSAKASGLIHQSATITVNVGSAGENDQYTHTFVSAATSAIVSGGNYTHNFAYAQKGGVKSGGNYLHTFVSAVDGGVTAAGVGTTTPTSATYNGETGELTLTIVGHGLNTGNFVGIATSAITFSCEMDQHNTDHAYPRANDPIANNDAIPITRFTTDTFTVNVGINTARTHDVTNAVYTPSTGVLVLTLAEAHKLITGQSVRIVDESMSFTCDMDGNASYHSYPRSTDPISANKVSIAATTATTITLNVGITTIVYYDVAVGSGSSATSYNAATGDLVLNVGMGHSLRTGRNIKIATDSLTFNCTKDGNATNHTYPRVPTDNYRGMEVVGIGTTVTELSISAGIATLAKYYQGGGVIQEALLVPRGTDAAASGATIITIIDTKSFTVNSGKSEYQHLYARSGSIERLMNVVIDDPLSYTDIPLAYSSDSPGTGGAQATIDVNVSMGSTVIDFEVKNTGYGYNVGHILTLPLTGTTGIPTTSSANFNEFQLTVEEADYDVFTGWSVGQLQVLDNFSDLFDGVRRKFPIKLNGLPYSIVAKRGSLITVQDTILVFINDILQVPGQGYEFDGGSSITFSEAPKGPTANGEYNGDTMKFLFYKGTGGGDVVDVSVIETIKRGDEIQLNYDSRVNDKDNYFLQQDTRTVAEVTATDAVDTMPFFGPGLIDDTKIQRPLTWCRQLEDKYVDGKIVSKDRELYQANIFPYAYLTQPVGVGTTIIYVDNLRPFFDPYNENDVSVTFQKDIALVSQDDKVSAAATAFIGTGSTVISVAISTGGRGYLSAPQVNIQNPVGLGTTARAEATASITAGVVTSITITTPGAGYTQTSAPLVLISPPTYTREDNSPESWVGDSGRIVGFGTTTTTSGPELIFDLYIPEDSYLRDATITGTAVTQCGLNPQDYFVIYNSNVGVADTGAGIGATPFTSKSIDDRVIGVSTEFVDSVFQVNTRDIIERQVIGIGTTSVTRIHTTILTGIGTENWDSGGITFDSDTLKLDNEASGNVYAGTISTSTNGQAYFGEYSWGKITCSSRQRANSYVYYGENGFAGLSTGDMIMRNPKLRTVGYST
jgi:hypothetical protein